MSESKWHKERSRKLIPDTLDLADRAALAINGLTGTMDPDRNWEVYFRAYFAARPPYMYHDSTGMPTNNPKFAESLPMMRTMCGSEQGLDAQAGQIEMILSQMGDDGLFYVLNTPDRPWHVDIGHYYEDSPPAQDYANTYGNARAILGLMAEHAAKGDEKLMPAIERMCKGLAAIAVKKGDYAYYPDCRVGEAFSFPRSGWLHTDEPQDEKMGAEGSMFMYHGGQIRAFARYFAMTGDDWARDIAQRLVNFVLKDKFWAAGQKDFTTRAHERGHYEGHHHAGLSVVRGVLELAVATRDTRLALWARDAYEWYRNYGIPAIGHVGTERICEGCSVGDMVGLAARLSQAGVGDYWDDVDRYTRNHLVEHQLTDKNLLKKMSDNGPERPHNARWGVEEDHRPHQWNPAPGMETDDRVIERSLGTFGGHSLPDRMPRAWVMQCCTGNASQGLYYAWESITRFDGKLAQVNLLLNRRSQWLDIESHLPYEGRVLLTNKQARTVAARLPNWADPAALKVTVNDKAVQPSLVGRYAIIEGLSGGERIQMEFPVDKRTEVYTLSDETYTIDFHGNTVVDISPRQDGPCDYPIYRRDAMKTATAAPRKEAPGYVPETVIPW